nr:unnamed protein product [Digitaria exilis]
MKSSLRKLRGFALQRHEQRVDRDRGRGHSTAAAAAADELLTAAQDMADMRSCYDNLLSVAAAIANSAYGNFLIGIQWLSTIFNLRPASPDGPPPCSGAELWRHPTAPVATSFYPSSLCLLPWLPLALPIPCPTSLLYRPAGGAPPPCLATPVPGRPAFPHFPLDKVLLLLGKSQFELRKLVDSYRVHVLNTITTPSQSLLNELQTVELNLFRKGLKSLEAVEPHVRLAAEQQHIDHQFSALEEEDYLVEDENDDDYNDSHDGELSFDYGENKEAEESGIF